MDEANYGNRLGSDLSRVKYKWSHLADKLNRIYVKFAVENVFYLHPCTNCIQFNGREQGKSSKVHSLDETLHKVLKSVN